MQEMEEFLCIEEELTVLEMTGCHSKVRIHVLNPSHFE